MVPLLWMLLVWSCGSPARPDLDVSMLPKVDDFALIDHVGRSWRLGRQADARAVVVYSYGVGCPIARRQLADLSALATKYEASGVRFVLLDASPQDDRAAIAAEAASFGITLPILHDDRQLVAEALAITRTGEAIVVLPSAQRLAWRGPIDDRLDVGAQRPTATRAFLQEALDAVLKGQPPPTDAPLASGCAIHLPRSKPARETSGEGSPTFVEDVAPVLVDRCQRCHRPGGVAPWAMTSFEVVRGWAPMMREMVRTRRMPPWHADPAVGVYANDLSLSVEEAQVIVHWAEEGTPRGDGPDPLVAHPPEPVGEWPLGPPDILLEVPTQRIPANGVLRYRHLRVPVPVTEPTWIRAADVIPSNASVLHHGTVVHVDGAQEAQRAPDDVPTWQEHFLTAFVPGMVEADVFPEESGRLLQPGDELRVTMHYVTTGKRETDTTRIGLYVADRPPASVYRVRAIVQDELRIPPGASEHKEVATWAPSGAVRLFGVFPHMHLRGHRFTLTVERPDGTSTVLLHIPQYDFSWQRWYTFKTPVDLPAGSVVTCTAVFDNSTANPNNPDPAARVRWGEQTTDEMLVGYVSWRSLE